MALAVADPVTIRTPMADGVELVADVYRPVGDGRHPVLLMRQPYGRAIASTVVLAHPAWYAAKGYVVMVQDVRGRGDSAGAFRVLADDVADGAETLNAAADLAGGDGRVATYGFSYQGMTQFMGLAGALKSGGVRPSAMAVAMAPWSVRDHWAFEGGAFRTESNQLWAVQMAAENARIAGDGAAYHAFRGAVRRLCSGPVPARLDVLDDHPAYTHHADWLADRPDDWAAASPDAVLAGLPLAVPSLHVGGWMDLMIDGTFAAYDAFRAGGAPTRLHVGPWLHLPWGRHVGQLDAGPEAALGCDDAILGFFEHVLKGRGDPGAPVTLYDLGLRRFRSFAGLPAGGQRVFHLSSTGRAAPTTADGVLTDEPAAAGVDRIVHDPWRPAPAVGLALGTPAGYQDRAAVDARGDVAVYTTAPLPADLVILGAARVDLAVTADRPSFDLAAVLSLVGDDGRAMTLCGGYRRVMADAAAAGRVTVTMRPTLVTLPRGCRLRLSLQAAAAPAFTVNPGTGERPEDVPTHRALVTTLTLRLGPDASRLVLPTADGA